MNSQSFGGDQVTVKGASQAIGEVVVPGDKSISHRALMLATLANGRTTLTGLNAGADVHHTLEGMRLLGAAIEPPADGVGVVVHGGRIDEPASVLDLGNSGTGIRLIAGLLAGFDFHSVLTGDDSLRLRPMDRIAEPLREMGARIDGRSHGRLAPLSIRGGGLRGFEYHSPVASAQVKSSVLFAGLNSSGITTVIEPEVTRRHTEELFAAFGIEVEIDGRKVSVRRSIPRPTNFVVPGDPSQAAFWAVAGVLCRESEIVTRNVYLGPERSGFLVILRKMGADIEVDSRERSIIARSSSLTGIEIDRDMISSAIDELPIIALAAARAQGRTTISGASELRHKETDRIATTAAMLRSFGTGVTETDDGLIIEGARELKPATVDTFGDHRIAMSAAIGALTIDGETVINGWECTTTSYPGFIQDLESIASSASVSRS